MRSASVITKRTNFSSTRSPRAFSSCNRPRQSQGSGRNEPTLADDATTKDGQVSRQEQGAMSRLLSELSHENLETGGRSAQKAINEAGFSEELKNELLDRISGAQAARSHAVSAFAQAQMPASAPKQSQDLAAAKPWTGTESLSDGALRMLNDASKPVRVPFKAPGAQRPPTRVDTGRPAKGSPSSSSGVRLANARDKTSMYSYLQDSSLSQKEREQMRKDLKERFTPAARSAPMTLRGLESLANERIEDAIARGQFKNITSRGKKLERDHNMSSPFLDTTEYFMNKIIQKQEIVPPWIEKQQEVGSTAARFRGRLRADWKRHAARLIASQGGPLESQIQRAENYARAEDFHNPAKKKIKDIVSSATQEAHMSQISPSGELRPPGAQQRPSAVEAARSPGIVTDFADHLASQEIPSAVLQDDTGSNVSHAEMARPGPLFRDRSWEANERSYHQTAIESLNSLTRSYNLMAPDLAKKPYFSLDRELKACYADVAPMLPSEIRDRALAPKAKVGYDLVNERSQGTLEGMFGAKTRVADERKEKQYGFREFWKDFKSSLGTRTG